MHEFRPLEHGHCSALLALLGTARHCSALLGTARHCSAMLGTARHVLPEPGPAATEPHDRPVELSCLVANSPLPPSLLAVFARLLQSRAAVVQQSTCVQQGRSLQEEGRSQHRRGGLCARQRRPMQQGPTHGSTAGKPESLVRCAMLQVLCCAGWSIILHISKSSNSL